MTSRASSQCDRRGIRTEDFGDLRNKDRAEEGSSEMRGQKRAAAYLRATPPLLRARGRPNVLLTIRHAGRGGMAALSARDAIAGAFVLE